jgi:hypothetical protein
VSGRSLLLLGALSSLLLLPHRASAFSLLGPYAEWMVESNGYRQAGDIGGPMNIDEGYRWNVPVVTYGFDQSFLDYFGSNGVVAIQGAFQVLNSLPPASSLALSNYPLNSLLLNYGAQTNGVYDLKSAALCLLVEQMGLAQPVRYTYALRRWDVALLACSSYECWASWAIPDPIMLRNFDPEMLTGSVYVNNILYLGGVFCDGQVADVYEIQVDLNSQQGAVAEARSFLGTGQVFAGLTRDDVGGLSYLLSANNVNYETLPPDVHGSGTNAAGFINGGWRPGVEKVLFLAHPWDSALGQFAPMTYQFVDTYLTNDVVVHQQLERIVTRPDILFSAYDVPTGSAWPFLITRTGTSDWVNNAAINGKPGGAGPGVIMPPITLAFQKLGPLVSTCEASPPMPAVASFATGWASFDNTTNPPIIYPGADAAASEQLAVRLRLILPGRQAQVPHESPTWQLPLQSGKWASLEVSTNLLNWTSVAVVSNHGAAIDWLYYANAHSEQFFRVVPQ